MTDDLTDVPEPSRICGEPHPAHSGRYCTLPPGHGHHVHQTATGAQWLVTPTPRERSHTLPKIPLDDPRVLALAKARQQFAHKCSFLPTWGELTDEDREAGLPAARNYLEAGIDAGLFPDTDVTQARNDAHLWASMIGPLKAAGVQDAETLARALVAIVRREQTPGAEHFGPGDEIPYNITTVTDLDGDAWERRRRSAHHAVSAHRLRPGDRRLTGPKRPRQGWSMKVVPASLTAVGRSGRQPSMSLASSASMSTLMNRRS